MVLRFVTGDSLMGKGRAAVFNSLSEADSGNRVLGGLAVSQRGAGANMSVDVAAGSWIAGGVASVTTSTTNVVISAADATNDRYDLITADNAGALAVVTGTAAAVPQVPALPANKIPLAVVSVPANDTTIETSQCVDVRCVDPQGKFLITSGTFSASASMDLTSITGAFNFLELHVDYTVSTTAELRLKINNDSPANKHSARYATLAEFIPYGVGGSDRAVGWDDAIPGPVLASGSPDYQRSANDSQIAYVRAMESDATYLNGYFKAEFPFYSSARIKAFYINGSFNSTGSSTNVSKRASCTFDSTAVISRITLTPSAGNLASGAYRLYGWY